jgi:hypothetical protein
MRVIRGPRAAGAGAGFVAAWLALAACGEAPPPSAPDAGWADAALDAALDAGVDASVCRARVALGGPCAVISDCDDGCFCNGAERCASGVCVVGTEPCVDAHACTNDVCDEPLRACAYVPDASRCDDADACNGLERCDVARGCEPGAPPVCDDDDDCTTDTCEAALGCVSEPRDRDGDGFGDGFCGGLDCVDDPARGGAAVAPGRVEVCDNGFDDDCDGVTDYALEACIPTNDDCASARRLPGPGRYVATTRGLDVDVPVDCAPALTPGLAFTPTGDAVFRFTLTEASEVAVSARGLGSLFYGSLGVSLRRFDACALGPELRPSICDPGERIRVRDLPAGEYAIVVASTEPTNFTLSLEVGPPTVAPPVDACGADMVEVGGGGSFSVYRSDLTDGFPFPCGASPVPVPDAVYRLTLDATKDVRLSLDTPGALALVRDCADPGATLSCLSFVGASPPTLLRRVLPAGTYYVLAEPRVVAAGVPSRSDAVTLSVRLSDPVPPPLGDDCSAAIPLAPGVPATVSLAPLAYDVTVPCAPDYAPLQRDVAFTFTTDAAQDVTLTVDVAGEAAVFSALTVTLASRCGEPGALRACTASADAVRFARTWRSLPAGEWSVVIGSAFDAGTITARLGLGPPTAAPVNDRCDGALPLVNGGTVTFEPASYDDDEATCAFDPGGDAYFTFTLPERQQVDLIATGPFGVPAALVVRRACGDASGLACVVASPAAFSEPLDAGTYSVLVEGASLFSAGDTIRLTSFFSPP